MCDLTLNIEIRRKIDLLVGFFVGFIILLLRKLNEKELVGTGFEIMNESESAMSKQMSLRV